MAKITISTSNLAGDIPTYEFTKFDLENSNYIESQLKLSSDKVFVSFQSWKHEKYEEEHPTFLISKSIEDTILWFEDFIEFMQCKSINYNFFCFETFEEAFEYCIDLKEGL